jgi:hypothetical protein
VKIRKTRAGTEVSMEQVEVEVVSGLLEQLVALLGPEEGEDADPLAALVGLTVDADRPADPALARLLPDAYGDDAVASREFRRYTDADLRAGKRAHAATVLQSLTPGTVVLDRDTADAWISSLNDLRLVLGTRLGVQQDVELDVDPDAPEAYAVQLYELLGWMQDAVLRTISPR